jgi:hypothetical protein
MWHVWTQKARSLLDRSDANDVQRPALVVSAPVARVRKGHDIRLIVPPADQGRAPTRDRDELLVRLLAEAVATREQLTRSGTQSVDSFAKETGACRKRVAQLVRLSYLSPTLVKLALSGQQPTAMTRRALLECDLPMAWADQHRQFGLAAAPGYQGQQTY